MSPTALFLPDGDGFVPTAAAVGPWDPRIVHGAAVAALFAGQLTPADRTLARLTVELLAPVPMAPLTWSASEPVGGSRVERRTATLTCGGRLVAEARSLTIRRAELDLPDGSRHHASPFDPATAPRLTRPNTAAREVIGWDNLDSIAVVYRPLAVPDEPAGSHAWLGLTLPVVEGSPLLGTELAAIAADYASAGASRRLPFDRWSFRNAELTMHLTRDPVGPWIGIRTDAIVQPVGAGVSLTELYDAEGRVGRSASALVVEQRHGVDR